MLKISISPLWNILFYFPFIVFLFFINKDRADGIDRKKGKKKKKKDEGITEKKKNWSTERREKETYRRRTKMHKSSAGQMDGKEKGRKKWKRKWTKEGKKRDRGSVVGKEEAREWMKIKASLWPHNRWFLISHKMRADCFPGLNSPSQLIYLFTTHPLTFHTTQQV